MERRGRSRECDVAGESERRRGRRPADPDEKTAPFSLRLTNGERALVDRAARRTTGAPSVAAWARSALVGAARAELAKELPGAGEAALPGRMKEVG